MLSILLLELFSLEMIIGLVVLVLVILLAVIGTLKSLLKKAAPGTALVKTGFGISKPKIEMSSALVVPMLHRVETIALTVKTVRISRRERDSLSCKDGIRAEVEVDFYIKVNNIEEDIRTVASTVGCERASDIQKMRELFGSKFSDALKTAGSKLSFDELYQNRRLFREEILSALGGDDGGDVVLNGYKLDDVAIEYLEQLPLGNHDMDNVLDARGIKEITQRTASEAEEANLRRRSKEVKIKEQDRNAETQKLALDQDLAEKRAKQEREIEESASREKALSEKTRQEQLAIEEQASILKQRQINIAQQERDQAITIAEKEKEQAIHVAEEKKLEASEIARIARESQVAEKLREKLTMLEQTALQEAQKIKAEETAVTVKAVEVANRDKQIRIINAEQDAAVEVAKRNVDIDAESYRRVKDSESKLNAAELDMQSAEKRAQVEIIEAEKEAKVVLVKQNVEADQEAYQLRTIASARAEAAELDFVASEKKAEAIRRIGEAEAAAIQAKLEAENSIGKNKILQDALNQLIPILPEVVEKLMLPAEKIESIKFLNINGLDPSNPVGGGGAEGGNANYGGSPQNSIVNTIMSVGLAMPVLKEAIKTIKGNDELEGLNDLLQNIPGSDKLLNYIEDFNEKKQDD